MSSATTSGFTGAFTAVDLDKLSELMKEFTKPTPHFDMVFTSDAGKFKGLTAMELGSKIHQKMGGFITPDLFNTQLSLKVVESQLCKVKVPNRVHKHRRNQKLSYHNRIQKKWNKRFGMHYDDRTYLFDSSLIKLKYPMEALVDYCQTDAMRYGFHSMKSFSNV